MRSKHMLSDANGNCPIGGLNSWEKTVVDIEWNRRGVEVLGWYRNPSQATENAIKVPYQKSDGTWSSLQPDFVFFTRKSDGSIAAALLEPHRDHGDSLAKLKGLADFAERNPDAYVRIEFMEEVDGVMKKLDITDAAVREAVRGAVDAKELFASSVAIPYA
jgi:type III restriction enzyme